MAAADLIVIVLPALPNPDHKAVGVVASETPQDHPLLDATAPAPIVTVTTHAPVAPAVKCPAVAPPTKVPTEHPEAEKVVPRMKVPEPNNSPAKKLPN